MAVKKNLVSRDEIVRELKDMKFRTVYYLHGEESYYTDRVAEYIVSQALTPDEQEFNLITVYATAETDMGTIITSAKRYPMMAERQVVMVREAQNLKHIEELENYLKKPQQSTILVFCHKNGKIDGRKAVAREIEKTGVLLESPKISDSQLPAFVSNYFRRKKLTIEQGAALLLAEHVGADLNRLVSEMDKLAFSLAKGETRVTSSHIERCTGVSREYNIFELKNAIITKDILKANKIAKYFDKNPKANPIQRNLAFLFKFFSELIVAYYATEKSEQGIASYLGFKNPWQSRDYVAAMRVYSGMKVMQIISAIRAADAKSKGVGNYGTTDGELFQDLIFFILH